MLARASWIAAALLAMTGGAAKADAGDAEFDDTFGKRRPAEPANVSKPVVVQPARAPAQPPPEPGTPSRVDSAPASEPVHNTVAGPTGGIHVVDAGSGKPLSARLSLALNLFRRRDFLVDGALHRHGGARLNVSVTPIEHLELAINTEAKGDQNSGTIPELTQTIGDTQLYAKGYLRPLPWLAIGGDLELAMLNTLGGLGFQTNAASVGMRGNGTFDLRRLDKPRKLIVRTGLGYFFDNSARLVRKLERYRYAALPDAAAPDSEYRHLVTATERFGYGINRLDHLGLDVGLEVPLAPTPGLRVHPIVEWRVALPINRQGYDCVVTRAAADTDGCLASGGFAARSSTLTLGARVSPYIDGLSLMAGLDIATSGARTLVRDAAPNAPYTILLQAAYAFERTPPVPPQIVVERVEVPVDMRRGHLLGMVIDDTTGAPVEHAFVDFEGHNLTTQATNASGRFTSYGLQPGRYLVRVTHPDYEDAVCAGELRDDFNDADVRCPLVPRLREQRLEGAIVAENALPVAGATVVLDGPVQRTLSSDASGALRAEALPIGNYQVQVSAPGFLPYAGGLSVGHGPARLQITLSASGSEPQVSLSRGRIRLKRSIQFDPGTAHLTTRSEALVSEVADLLARHAEVRRVEVRGHTDDSGDEAKNLALSEARAQAVVDMLVSLGVARTRLEAKGFGASEPVAPNITPANRAQNRRVELAIVPAE
jgi:outer membrane protein OmpA-like peptidoglycan-associated protein